MYKTFIGSTIVSSLLLLSFGTAHAFVGAPDALRPAAGLSVLPAAMCGVRCEYGGPLYPGPAGGLLGARHEVLRAFARRPRPRVLPRGARRRIGRTRLPDHHHRTR